MVTIMSGDCKVCGEHDLLDQCSNCGAVMCEHCMNGHGCLMVECPRCHAAAPDHDGFGFVSCSACGYCTHPSRSDGVCGICGNVETTNVRRP